jgi:hypothetical protein
MAWMWPHEWLLISNTVLGRPANWLVGWPDTISSSALLFKRRDEQTPIQMEQAVPGTACPVLLCVYWLRAFHGTSTELVHRLDWLWVLYFGSLNLWNRCAFDGDVNKTQESFKATINKLKLLSCLWIKRDYQGTKKSNQAIISRSSRRQHPTTPHFYQRSLWRFTSGSTASWLSTWDSIPIDKHRGGCRDNKPWNSW